MAKMPTTLPNAIGVIKRQAEEIRSLQTQLEAARARKQGLRSSGVQDRYTEMQVTDLRALIIKRHGNPDEVVEGLHSRARSIAMREWLRANPAKKPAAYYYTPDKKTKRVVKPAAKAKAKRGM